MRLVAINIRDQILLKEQGSNAGKQYIWRGFQIS